MSKNYNNIVIIIKYNKVIRYYNSSLGKFDIDDITSTKILFKFRIV